ncbi:MAG: 30S ribosomal protein S3 [Ignavibacteriales bacterium]|nr:30S ribosomal protein S3 [Ignavibacteriales bacterium]
MGQKTHPIGFRLGGIRSWDSNWYSSKKDFSPQLVEDLKLRKYVFNRLKKASVGRVLIERKAKRIEITIFTSRPGIVIGRSGKDIQQLEEELKKVSKNEVKVLIQEIKRPELDATLLADQVAQQLEGRVTTRRAMKAAIMSAMRMGAAGVRVMCSGRLGGAEIARAEQYKEGRIPLQTLRSDIDFARATAHTIYGALGVKVWICRGDVLEMRKDN